MYRVMRIFTATGQIMPLPGISGLRVLLPSFLQTDRYVCRRDRAGVVYDKAAMLQVSRMLGHNRISVIAGHYLHD